MSSFADLETSVHGGQPWEAFVFTCGVDSWRYTSHDQTLTIDGYDYEPEAITHDELGQNDEDNSQELKLQLPLDNPVVSLFQGYLPPEPVSVVIYRGHLEADDHIVHYTGTVSSPSFDGSVCELTLVPEQNALNRTVPGLNYNSQCLHQVFDDGCGLFRGDFEVIATLAGVSGRVLTAAAFGEHDDGYFTGGWVDAAGTSMTILKHIGTAITISHALDLAIGDSVVASPGCPGTESVCRSRFNNITNHLGWCRIPGINPFTNGVA
nr:DUF2163 domain-containing protein [uncultured Holophaga sp.]